MSSFYEFLKLRIAGGGFTTEDTLASLLPLMRQVNLVHAAGQVAPLAGIQALQVEGARIWFPESMRHPPLDQLSGVQKILRARRGPVEVLGPESRGADSRDLSPGGTPEAVPPTSEPPQPAFVPGFLCWEHLLDHHDPLTDIFSLGQLLASLALGLDFNQPADVQRFARHRRNLFEIEPSVHPVMARVIVQMTELDRHQRAQDLAGLITSLENYRLQEIEVSVDPDEIEGFQSRDLQGKQQVLLDRLQKRLFEISRRNRLLNFQPTGHSVNLTEASVPLSFDYHNVRADQLLVGDQRLTEDIAAGRPISLNRHLNFSEALYLPGALDQILRQSRRDLAEYGFVQLRLVLCMLDWANLKIQPAERFRSPLVLVPVHLRKQRGVRDTYSLQPVTSQADINPVVRYLFRQWYAIELPEQLDLSSADLNSLYEFMSQAISASEPAVELKRIDRPQIRLLHTRARRQLERYQRRSRISGRGVRTFMGIDYSYDWANYHPLGFRLFSTLIRPPRQPLTAIRHHPIRPRCHVAADGPSGEQRPASPDGQPAVPRIPADGDAIAAPRFFEMADAADDNPWNWSFDLCNVTLANFRYRQMSLVRDYEQLVAETPRNEAFESVFSLTPRPTGRRPSALPLEDRFDVVPCDPTQAWSIAEARQGSSYIIQGPPGTGKSQTITNLIADYAGRGQRVLFVCEKRAAIDVVFARLRQCGLGELCCLIHDSQADKKAFIMDLRETCESFLKRPSQSNPVAARRGDLLAEIAAAIEPLEAYADVMGDATWQAGIPTGQLLEHVTQLRSQIPGLDEWQQEYLPDWRSWNEHRSAIEVVIQTLARQQPDGVLARHPLRNLAASLAADPAPLHTVREGIDHARAGLERLDVALAGMASVRHPSFSFARIRRLVQYSQTIQPLVESAALELLDPGSAASSALESSRQRLRELQQQLQQQREINSAWKTPIPRRDLSTAMETANRLARHWIPMMFPAWWRLRRVMNRSYDFSTHTVRPGWVAVLTNLQREYQAEDAVHQFQREAAGQFGWQRPWQDVIRHLESIRDAMPHWPDWLQELHDRLFKPAGAVGDSRSRPADPQRVIQDLVGADSTMRDVRHQLDEFLTGYEMQTMEDIRLELQGIEQAIHLLPDYVGCLKQMATVPEDVRVALQRMDLTPSQIEAAAAARTLTLIGRERSEFREFDRHTRSRCLASLGQARQDWMSINADYVRQQVRQRFLEHMDLSSSPAAGSSKEDREFRKTWSSGRKALEHEFGKQMRYRSIRDLVSGDTGQVIRDLKPVWLMSPLSVSDTLPLGDHPFDVVIFDEASQITLESAVPSLFRAGQAIVVGDEQQLPPTSFFSANSAGEDEEITFEEEGQMVAYDLERGSLLNHSARNLPSTMLGWHYRSRDEMLISFSNAAFYDGRLLTIPEEKILCPGSPPLRATSPESAVAHVAALTDRPISFHWMEHGLYQRRRNRPEAEYIAELVRQLLISDHPATIGIIAFSEAQQDEIELAVERLAETDAGFSRRLESELVREDDGQFTGLLIKNLENIQGDERDIVILSICYGPDADGRMLMNFGPINQHGGEKRLNVAFSRAKHHMAIISSIGHGAITNRHNVGANCLRNYLCYAEAVSGGDATAAAQVLHGLSPPGAEREPEQPVSPVLQDIARQLSGHGLQADFNVGHSEFRCDIGLRRNGDTRYRLGLLVDAGDWYQRNTDTIDRELNRPRLLEIFGWRVYFVLTREWLDDSQKIVQEILESCQTAGEA